MDAVFDLAVIGVGLSGSRVLIELIDRLTQHPTPKSLPLRIALFDRTGEFGKGIPYGSYSDRHCMLIETLEHTRCPPFSEWIKNNPHMLIELRDSPDPYDREWYRRNSLQVANQQFDQLYLQRHLFGNFSSGCLEQRLCVAQERGLIHIHRFNQEVLSLVAVNNIDEYRVTTIDGTYTTKRVVLAVGSIPRRDQFLSENNLQSANRYINDNVFCGSFQLAATLSQYLANESSNTNIRLVIIGAAASAIESIYYVARHSALISRVTSITTISRSGLLPGGLCDPAVELSQVSDYARHRTSAKEYITAARSLHTQGKLRVIGAHVESIQERPEGFAIQIKRTAMRASEVLEAELVINCSGSGDLCTTPSSLLRKMTLQLQTEENDRGFLMRDKYRLLQWPGVWVAGPLLNRSGLNSHVESIAAVFRVGGEIGALLHSELLQTTALCA